MKNYKKIQGTKAWARDNKLLKSGQEIYGANYGKIRVILVRFICTNSSQEIDFLSPVVMFSSSWHREGTPFSQEIYILPSEEMGKAKNPSFVCCFSKAFNSKNPTWWSRIFWVEILSFHSDDFMFQYHFSHSLWTVCNFTTTKVWK